MEHIDFQSALDELADSFNTSNGESLHGFTAVCPHCGTLGTFHQLATDNLKGKITKLEEPGAADRMLMQAVCPSKNCQGVCVVASAYVFRTNGNTTHRTLQLTLLWPRSIPADRAPTQLPHGPKRDYDEARSVLAASPRASAALARRCLQHILRDVMAIKVSSGRLVDEIDKAKDSPQLSQSTKESLDHVRHIGNLAAHPGGVVGLIDDVTHEEAAYTIGVLELLFNDLYAIPERVARMTSRLAKPSAVTPERS